MSLQSVRKHLSHTHTHNAYTAISFRDLEKRELKIFLPVTLLSARLCDDVRHEAAATAAIVYTRLLHLQPFFAATLG